ncbi:hypothetical protein [Xanthomonas hortorum]|uniref:hypothetical protein n=1 Tax=Xanthomonas hortorum TaxID=56454 RepID=UPI0001FD5654|nr:hypothetical protein [Xanthomonas hortorum]APP78393.1 hypothetical protein BJD10_00490 [Xanthomonas hortorum pv. gardneri]EGD17964.1 hypothetical protein XGA_3420 [Xanthomonas hortorum ATCC 19865]KLA94610.1 hypothetical protein SM17710_19445 [Xanthomonas hortorum pv. gardneri]KLA97049.1 hypothetical protein SM18210_19500 [Xanthomonas hortorum pv. gardneri]KLA97154.1 hypothetical protein SM19410_10935 [Xanthomonas hortorum pv. gardneri]
MATTHNPFLLVAGGLNALAALLHLGCIAAGPAGYRLLGAGDGMAQMASAGHWYPTVVTLIIVSILLVWALYALSGAGLVRRLPLLRWVLLAITGVYLLRGLFFAPLMAHFPGNSMTFWYASSAICLAFGIVHAVGLRQSWSRL